MKTIIGQDEASGKTVATVMLYFEYAAIHFTDGTSLVVQGQESYDDSIAVAVVDGHRLFGFQLSALGIIAEEEVDAFDARRDAEEAAEEEAKARQTYEELRLRFGVKP